MLGSETWLSKKIQIPLIIWNQPQIQLNPESLKKSRECRNAVTFDWGFNLSTNVAIVSSTLLEVTSIEKSLALTLLENCDSPKVRLHGYKIDSFGQLTPFYLRSYRLNVFHQGNNRKSFTCGGFSSLRVTYSVLGIGFLIDRKCCELYNFELPRYSNSCFSVTRSRFFLQILNRQSFIRSEKFNLLNRWSFSCVEINILRKC